MRNILQFSANRNLMKHLIMNVNVRVFTNRPNMIGSSMRVYDQVLVCFPFFLMPLDTVAFLERSAGKCAFVYVKFASTYTNDTINTTGRPSIAVRSN